TPSGTVVVQTNETPSKWVVCFDLPSASSMSAVHKDLKTVTINGQSFDISVNSSGAISYDSAAPALSTSAPTGMVANQNTGMSFNSTGQASYFKTGDEADEKEKVYNITVTDTAGLSSSLSVSARGFKLSNPAAYKVDDSSYANPLKLIDAAEPKNNISQEEDGSARVRIHAEALTASFEYQKIKDDGTTETATIEAQAYDASNAYIVYEFYKEAACATLLGSGRIAGLTGTVTMPDTNCWIKAFVRKPLYADSDALVWQCHAVCANYYVSSSGLSTNAGSKAAPLDTIQHAIDKFVANIADFNGDDTVTVNVMSNLGLSGSGATWDQSGTGKPTLKIAGYGATRTIDYANNATSSTIGVSGGTVVINNVKFANCNDRAVNILGGARVECNSCVFDTCSAGTSSDGGAVYIGSTGSATFNSCTIKGCQAARGAAIYADGALLIKACSITGNTTTLWSTTESDQSGAVHYAVTATGFSILEGTTRILENPNSGAGKDIDVYLPFGKVINTEQDLASSRIGVFMPFTTGDSGNAPTTDKRVVFTNGYQNNNSGKKPGQIFVSNNGYGIAIGKTAGDLQEAAFAVSGGGMYTAFDYTISFEAADASVTGMYPGADFTYVIKPTIIRKEKTSSPP
ncbi:MAG: hypothetical protein J5700_08070, partial [Treponema sp.]|nr:hypothetical protein [Treponema sp.]